MRHRTLVCLALAGAMTAPATASPVEFLDARRDLMVHVRQGWGELGINRAAHARDQTPLPLRIADKSYARGIGHHAPGEIVVDLGGQYSRFEADVGVQAIPNCPGSVVFQVFVDDARAFDSGVMRGSDPPKAVSVPVAGAMELRLVATDAGDGITCDLADWADARLIRDPAARPAAATDGFDAARFARVVTGDPARMDGTRATRTQEFPADDLYLDTDVFPDAQGRYVVPAGADGQSAIGLRWIERRHVRSLAIEFDAPPDPRLAERACVQFWTGESPYQGQWKPLNGLLVAHAGRWTLRADRSQNPDLRNGTWKIRWVLPAPDGSIRVRRLEALTASVVRTADLTLQLESADPGAPVDLEMYNGEFVEPAAFAGRTHARVEAAASIPIRVRHIASRSWQSDRAVLRLRTPSQSLAVAIDDVLAHGTVCVPAARAMVSLASAKETLADVRTRLAGRETVLQDVRRRPDQTFAQAIARVHHAPQDPQPTMLSLACDNRKYIAYRDGAIAFALPDDPDRPMPPDTHRWPCLLRPACGSGRHEKIERHLDGGWYPVPLVTIEDGGVIYRQRAFVVPYDRSAPPADNPWLNPRPLLVAAFTIENPGAAPAETSLKMTFLADTANNHPAEVHADGARGWARAGDRLMAAVEADRAAPLALSVQDGSLALKGRLEPGQKVECAVYLPGWRLAPADHASLTGGAGLMADCRAYWDRVLSGAMQVDLPDALLVNVIKASQVHCLMAARNEAAGRRVAPWIASVSYGPLESEAHSIIRGMSFFGHDEFARRSFDFFIHRYDPAGFLTTGYTVMGTGWHLWTLGEHHRVARDDDWLRGVAPKVANVCRWVMKQRAKTRRPDARGQEPPEAGLMPPGVMADWNVYAFYMYLNGYYCAGLRDAGRALAQVGVPEAESFVADADAFARDIRRAFHATQAITPVVGLRDGTFVPPGPAQLLPGPTGLFFPGEDGNRSWCYDVELGAHHLVPFGVLPADGPDAAWMADALEDVQFLSEGLLDYPAAENHKDPFNLGGFAKVQPYYCRIAEVHALRDDVRPFVRSYFNTIPSLLSLENLCFQEHFHAGGAWNKTHETGYFLHQTRIMLVLERGDELWLAPLVTSGWLDDGATIAVRGAPTFFGPVSYRIDSHAAAGHIEATIEPPARSAPKQIVLRLRHPQGRPIRKVAVDGKDHTDFDASRDIIRLAPTGGTMKVRAEY